MKAVEPLILTLPIAFFIINSQKTNNNRESKAKTNELEVSLHLTTENGEWIERNKLDDKKREDVIEYLILGIRSICNSTQSTALSTHPTPSLCQRIMNCFTQNADDDNEFEPPRSINHSTIDGTAPLLGQVELKDPKEIAKECGNSKVVKLSSSGLKTTGVIEKYFNENANQEVEFEIMAPKVIKSLDICRNTQNKRRF